MIKLSCGRLVNADAISHIRPVFGDNGELTHAYMYFIGNDCEIRITSADYDRFAGPVLNSSDEWAKIVSGILTVLDPDGWDRSDYAQSWYVERITFKEFLARVRKSTIRQYQSPEATMTILAALETKYSGGDTCRS